MLIDSAAPVRHPGLAAPFDPHSYAAVGMLDIDWLLDSRFTRLLDNFAASPGAFRTVRFFGALSSGEKENVFPWSSGSVWNDPSREPDFTRTLDAIEALVSRALLPFVSLTFFPRAVAPSPITPPSDWRAWQSLLRRFFTALAQRFGKSTISTWPFEVWNEPNMTPFWHGSFEQYLQLYRATSDVIRTMATPVRIGGPTIAYVPNEGPALMERFLRYLRDEPATRCDFISYHRKGIWVQGENEPSLRRLVEAAEEVAGAVLRLTPGGVRGLPLVNNEADMKVAFDQPYEPRMTEQFPAWMAGVTAACDTLDTKYAAHGMRFVAASDNANQQLVRGPFDGRRSVMTQGSASPSDLLKLPIYNFYELLRLLGDRHAVVQSAPYPPDVVHLSTVAADRIAILLSLYPEREPVRRSVSLQCIVRDLPWHEVNIVAFRIDSTLSNSYSAAGHVLDRMPVALGARRQLRFAQELATEAPIRTRVPVDNTIVMETITLERFATVLLWITPFSDRRPAPPAWVRAVAEDGNVVLDWEPTCNPGLYSYKVTRVRSGSEVENVVPMPLRSARWVDTQPEPGEYTYEIRVLTASGVLSEAARSQPVRA
ncbi:MAG: hypothetical protein M3Y41_13715 [Pseudomonadota bacterium]|nr:hypothetical protein [Pseudomonadota bacterium]